MQNLRSIRLLVASLSSLVPGMVTPHARAFPATWIANMAAGAGESHPSITERAVTRVLREDLRIPELSDSMELAMEQLEEANGNVDSIYKQYTRWHFDAENFVASHENLFGGRLLTARLLRDGNPAVARVTFGEILHPLQDFYAHSNWVELGNRAPLLLLNAPVPQPGPSGSDPASSQSPVQLVSAWQAMAAPPNEPTCVPCESGCRNNLITPRLTSGYCGGEDIDATESSGKCRHGGVAELAYLDEGISKDSPAVYVAPHYWAHRDAAQLAEAATVEFLRSMRAELTLPEYLTLLGFGGPSFGVVMDTTESMQPVIDAVKEQVRSQGESLSESAGAPSMYVLVPFNDPVVGPHLVTPDYSDFEDELDELRATGGGDCPEPSMTGLMLAVNMSPPGTSLFLFTNSAAKDPWLADAVGAAAASKSITIFAGLLGSCSPYSEAFFDVAERTGGQAFVLDESEVSLVQSISDTTARAGATRLAQRSFELTGEEQSFEFEVESSLEEILVTTSGITPDGMPPDATAGNDTPTYAAVLESPSGETIVSGDGVDIVDMTFGSLTRIASPEPGLWRLRLGGTGHARVVVEAVGGTSLVSFRFLEPSGPAGLDEYLPIRGAPLAGETYLAQARFRGEVDELEIQLVSANGDVIGRSTFEKQGSEAGRSRFAGEVAVPEGLFTVRAIGVDKSGDAFERSLRAVGSGQHVTAVVEARHEATPGSTVSFDVDLRNAGPDDEFRVSVADDRGYLVSSPEATLALEEGEEGKIPLEFWVPVDAATPSTSSIEVSVASVTDPTKRTFAAARLVVSKSLASDEDLVPAELDNCPGTSNPEQTDLDGDTVGDACDDDRDGDGVANGRDNCSSDSNPGQSDSDGDGRGDECDSHPNCACSVPGVNPRLHIGWWLLVGLVPFGMRRASRFRRGARRRFWRESGVRDSTSISHGGG